MIRGMRPRHVFAVLLCAAVAAVACDRVYARRLPVTAYTIADGLAQDSARAFLADRHGYLWIGTRGGLSRFDGHDFATYGTKDGLPDAIVNDIAEDASGTLWIATPRGLARYAPEGSPRFVPVPLPLSSELVSVNALEIDGERGLWTGTDGGLFRLATGGDTTPPIRVPLPLAYGREREIWSLAADGKGGLWVGTQLGLFRRDADGACHEIAERPVLPGDEVQELLVDRSRRLWIGTRAGLCIGDSDAVAAGAAPCTARFDDRNGLAASRVEGLYEARDGTVWVAAREATAFPPGASLAPKRYGPADGLPRAFLYAVGEDADGNLWFGYDASGAVRVSHDAAVTFDVNDGFRGLRPFQIAESRGGKVFVLTQDDDGRFLNVSEGDRFTAIPVPLPPSIHYAGWGWNQTLLQGRDGDWWLATGEGLVHLPPESEPAQLNGRGARIFTHRDGLPGDQVFRVFEDVRGDVWFSLLGVDGRALARRTRDDGRFVTFGPADGVPAEPPTAFAESPAGRLWVGFYMGGLSRSEGVGFKAFGRAEGVPRALVQSIVFDRRGRLWAATGEGLIRCDDPDAPAPSFRLLGPRDGLSSEDIRAVAETAEGAIAAGSPQGLDVLDPDSGDVRRFTSADGVAGNCVQALFRDRSGRLWIGTLSGLSMLGPIPPPSPPRATLVGSVEVSGASFPISDLGVARVEGLGLSWNERRLAVGYRTPSFRSGERILYQHRLVGLDAAWSTPDERRSVEFAGLGLGAYALEVRAVHPDGVAGTAAIVAFSIQPPFWRTWWFLGAAVVAAGSTGFAAHRLRLTRAIEIERVRARIATDLHDDIGAGLSQIAVMTEVLSRDLAARGGAPTPLPGRMGEIARELVESMGEIVWAINPERDRFMSLSQRIRRHATEVLRARGVAMGFASDEGSGEREVRGDVRREMLLAFKEMLSNAVRHGECTRVEIALRLDGAALRLSVTDDGRGFDPSSAEEGTGLSSLRRRAERLGGRATIESAPGHGTTVSLSVPLRGERLSLPERGGHPASGRR